MNRELRDEFREAWIRVKNDPEIWCAIVTGAGRAFPSGADVESLASGGFQGSFTATYKSEQPLTERIDIERHDARRPWQAQLQLALGEGPSLPDSPRSSSASITAHPSPSE